MNECLGLGNKSCLQSVKPALRLLLQLLRTSPSLQLMEVHGRNSNTSHLDTAHGGPHQLAPPAPESPFELKTVDKFCRSGKLDAVLPELCCLLRRLSQQPRLQKNTSLFSPLRSRLSFCIRSLFADKQQMKG